MDLDQSALAVIDLLMEPSRCFVRIDMFDVASAPAMPSWHIVPIPSAAVSQVGPIAKFALVLSPFPFVQWHSDATLLAASPTTHPLRSSLQYADAAQSDQEQSASRSTVTSSPRLNFRTLKGLDCDPRIRASVPISLLSD